MEEASDSSIAVDSGPESQPETTPSKVTVSPLAAESVGSSPVAVLDKVTLLLKATGSTPMLKKKTWSVKRSQTIGQVITFLRMYISCAPNESLFIYVNQCFAPSMDAEIGPLHDCFSSDGKLVLHYCKVINILCDFIETAIHIYLHQRGVYPRESFSERVVFGVHVQLCCHPSVRKYISDCVESLRPLLPQLRELRLAIHRAAAGGHPSETGDGRVQKNEYLEALVFRFDMLNEEFIRCDKMCYLMKEYFATMLLCLNLHECLHPPLSTATTWELWARTSTANVELPIRDPTGLHWMTTDNKRPSGSRRSAILPVKSFHNECMQMQLLVDRVISDEESL